jgi:hypothetical protein
MTIGRLDKPAMRKRQRNKRKTLQVDVRLTNGKEQGNHASFVELGGKVELEYSSFRR